MNLSERVRDVGDDEPVLLTKAPELFFPPGMMKVNTLRTEARKGTLATIRIGGKDYVTRKDIQDMIRRCREHGNRPALKSEPKRTDAASGSSATGNDMSAQEALRIRLETPNSRFRSTSPTKGPRPTRANVTPLRSS